MKKDIAIIIRALDRGGAERCASNLSIDLSTEYNTHLILFDGKTRMYPAGKNVYDVSIPPSNFKIIKMLNIIKRVIQVYKIKKENNIKVSISLLDGANLVNVYGKSNDKIIVSIRNYMSMSKLSKLKVFLLKKYCKKADCVVALSQTVKDDLINNFGISKDKIEVVYNACDSERLTDLANKESESALKINGPYIVTMGRLTYQKGQWHLIKAFKRVCIKYPDIKLVILGEGELKEELIKIVDKLGISNNVIFMGYVKNPHKIIKESELFVFSSLYEGLGNVLLEALACGKAIISTDCLAGPREILEPDSDLNITERGIKEIEYCKYGVLVPSFDQEEVNYEDINISEKEEILGDAIIKLLEDTKLKVMYEEKANERIKDFSPEKINEDWKNIIENLINS